MGERVERLTLLVVGHSRHSPSQRLQGRANCEFVLGMQKEMLQLVVVERCKLRNLLLLLLILLVNNICFLDLLLNERFLLQCSFIIDLQQG